MFRKMNESLSYEKIMDKFFYTGQNNHSLQKCYKQKIHKVPNSESKLSGLKWDQDKGYLQLRFSVPVTDSKKENLKIGETNKKATPNTEGLYTVLLRVMDFSSLMKELKLEVKDMKPEDLAALIELSENIMMNCDCPSMYFSGSLYFLSQKKAAIYPTNLKPTKNLYRQDVCLCKHIEGILEEVLPQSLDKIVETLKKNYS